MKSKIKFAILISLALSFILYPACKRKALEEPSPLGPSSLSIVLNVSASPNVLFAGQTRQRATITASLKKYDGVPLSDETIYFEIHDQNGNQVNMGYFEGNQAVQSKTTDGNGVVTLSYYGPLSDELTTNATLYVNATVAWEGKESISEICPVYVIREVSGIKFELSAQPNVLVAGETRGISTITAALMTAQDVPLADQTVHFEITDEQGSKLNLGYFEGNQLVVTENTDENGTVTVQYYGPLSDELDKNTTVYITAHVAWEGCEEHPSANCAIHMVKDITDASLEVTAQPNVLYAGDSRESSTVTAILTTAGGAPLAGQTIYFEIHDESGNQVNTGYFENNQMVVTKTTDASGTAAATYYGPLSDELSESTTIYIAATATRDGEDYISENASIYIIRDVTDVSLEVTAQPNVLYAGDSRESSTVTAILTTAGGAPLAGQTIYFEIHDESGNQVNTGYFENNQMVVTKTTDASGTAAATYYGPLSDELSESTTIYIAATATRDGEDYISENASLYIIRDVTDASLEVTAQPNVIVAGDSRGSSTITATLQTVGGDPLAGQTIYFEIQDESGEQVSIGYFGDHEAVKTKITDENGTAKVVYHGPLGEELTESTTVYINATATREGEEYISKSASVYIIRDFSDITLDISAHPNVIKASTSREESTIFASVEDTYGKPLANLTVHFEVQDENGSQVNIGHFGNDKIVVTKQTNEEGVASATYSGPLASEITANTTVYIAATVEYEGEDVITATTSIYIVREGSHP
ncbi:MAG: hypothetical protein ACLFVG_06310 [Candidatus Aminicenantes bacterium]